MKKWRRRIVLTSLFGALVLTLLWFQGLLGIGRQQPAAAPEPPAVPAGARSARVERRSIASNERHPGFVEAVDPVTLAPRVMATILSIEGREGEAVAQGALLVRLDDRDARSRQAQAEAAAEAAEAGATRARSAWERADRLHQAQSLTEADWEAARAEREMAEASLLRARAAVAEAAAALSWFELRAPVAGRILTRDADPGALALPGQPLLTLYREDALRLRVTVPEGTARELSVGQAYTLELDGLPERELPLTRLLPATDERTGTLVLHFDLPAELRARPGSFGRLSLAAGERQALLAPRAAIEQVGQLERAQILHGGRLWPVMVRTGKVHGELVEVLAGLSEGEEVLLR